MLPALASAGVVINEIAWMGTEVSTSDEWIELYNSGAADVSLDGWMLEAEDGQPSIALSGNIAANRFFLLERTDDETVPGIAADLIYTGALGNDGEKLELKDANRIVVDTVDATSPPAGGGWPAGDNATKETMQKSSLPAGGWITSAGTPYATNVIITSGGNTEIEFQNSETKNESIIHDTSYIIQKQLFIVDAGDDVRTVAGAEVRFFGAAYSADGKPLDEATGTVRYLWNFGDGAFFEAKNVNHMYRYPGAYRAALYVSSGHTSGGDVIEVSVGESHMVISEITGTWIELINEGDIVVDLSSWQIRDSTGQSYTLPARTIIGPRAFIVFSQETTGLLFGALNPKAELRYANGVLADEFSFTGTLPADKSVMREESGDGVLGEPTPGKENKLYHVASSMYHGEITKEKMPTQKAETVIATKAKEKRNENKNPVIHNTSYMLQAKTENSVFASNYFWLATSVSVGLLAGAVVLLLRGMILF